jgi:hypothetical protein
MIRFLWTQKQDEGPSPRTFSATGYDTGRGRTVLFGGGGDNIGGAVLGDAWEWDGANWTQMAVSGPLARNACAAYDAQRHQTQKIDHRRSIGRELLRTIGVAALIVFGLGRLAMADEVVPAEYQGVWAAARNCNDNFQNVISDAVNRKLAACRVTQLISSGNPESHTSTVSLNCGGLQSHEIWHDESSEGVDYLVIVQLEQGAAAGRQSIDLYKRCPEIPLGEIPLSDIPGNPIVNTATEEKTAPPSPPRILHHRLFPYPRATRIRKLRPQ